VAKQVAKLHTTSGNVFPSWKVFVSTIRKKFCFFCYKEKDLIEWQALKLRKGQTVKEYTDGFHKMELMLDIPLHTQETLMKYIGNVFPSWKVFFSTLRKKFYPLCYKEKALIEWQALKLRKGQTVQEYTDGFHKMALMLNIPLHTQETLMKYIGGLPTHI
jgi:hypothetical protein